MPLILGTDKKRLSKRHGATSVMEYQRLGYLSEAMVNFLALLGWSPGGDQELFTRDELVERFTLEGISGGNAVFNPEKLDWVNQQHLQRLPLEEVADRLRPALETDGLWSDAFDGPRRDWFLKVVALFRPRIRKLDQFGVEARPLLTEEVDIRARRGGEAPQTGGRSRRVLALADAWAAQPEFTAGPLEVVPAERWLRHAGSRRPRSSTRRGSR